MLSFFVDKNYLDSLKAAPDAMKVPWYGQLMRVPQVYGYLIQLDTVFRSCRLAVTD